MAPAVKRKRRLTKTKSNKKKSQSEGDSSCKKSVRTVKRRRVVKRQVPRSIDFGQNAEETEYFSCEETS